MVSIARPERTEAAGVFRVMVLGGSLTFVNFVTYEDTFAALATGPLAAGRRVEVMLPTVGGWTPPGNWPPAADGQMVGIPRKQRNCPGYWDSQWHRKWSS